MFSSTRSGVCVPVRPDSNHLGLKVPCFNPQMKNKTNTSRFFGGRFLYRLARIKNMVGGRLAGRLVAPASPPKKKSTAIWYHWEKASIQIFVIRAYFAGIRDKFVKNSVRIRNSDKVSLKFWRNSLKIWTVKILKEFERNVCSSLDKIAPQFDMEFWNLNKIRNEKKTSQNSSKILRKFAKENFDKISAKFAIDMYQKKTNVNDDKMINDQCQQIFTNS